MGLQSENSLKALARSLLDLHIKLQFLSSIWKGDVRDGLFFKVKKKKNPDNSFPLS